MSKRKAETSFQSDSDEYSEGNYEDSVEKEVSENEEDINLSHDGKLFFVLTNLPIPKTSLRTFKFSYYFNKNFIQIFTYIIELLIIYLASMGWQTVGLFKTLCQPIYYNFVHKKISVFPHIKNN